MNYFAQTYTTTTTHASGKTLLLFGLAFVIFIAVFIALYVRRREITFTGVVEDKNINENQVQNNNMMNRPGITIGNNGGVTHTYMIKVKTDAGKTVNYQISEGKYEIIKIGDRVSKAKGTTEVEIVSSAPAAPTTPVAPPPPPASPIPPAPTNPTTPQTFA